MVRFVKKELEELQELQEFRSYRIDLRIAAWSVDGEIH